MNNIFRKITTGFTIFRLVMKDSKTPFWSKLLVGVSLVYLLAPLDMIPDFITILGHFDDIVIIPLLILAAFKIIPSGLIKKYRDLVTKNQDKTNSN